MSTISSNYRSFSTYILVNHLEEGDAETGVIMSIDVSLWRLVGVHVFFLGIHHLGHQTLHIILHLLLTASKWEKKIMKVSERMVYSPTLKIGLSVRIYKTSITQKVNF